MRYFSALYRILTDSHFSHGARGFVIILTLLLTVSPAFAASPLDQLTPDQYRARIQFVQKLSEDVIAANRVPCLIQKDQMCFRAGAFWSQFWVRDTAYSALLGLGNQYPTELKNTFVELLLMWGAQQYPVQDASADFGGFPYQSDSIVWVVGAFELAKQTNDREFRTLIAETARRMEPQWKKVENPRDSLIVGAPSFLDAWSLVPTEWKGKRLELLRHKFLSTNVLWLRYNEILFYEGQRLGWWSAEEAAQRQSKLTAIRQSLDSKLYNAEKGYYVYYQGRSGTSDRYEALGNILMQKFGYAAAGSIRHPQTAQGFYPVLSPIYPSTQEGDWYAGMSQFIWIDAFGALVQKEYLYKVCNRYFDVLHAYKDIKEMVVGGEMRGGEKQLWAAVALWSFFHQSQFVGVADTAQ